MTGASALLREGLLEGVSILVAGAGCDPAPGAGSPGAAAALACAELGAHVHSGRSIADPRDPGEGSRCSEDRADEAVRAALRDAGSLELLVVDGAGLFAWPAADRGAAQASARGALRGCLEGAWNLTRAATTLAFLPCGRGGRIVYLAPARGAGLHADAARAGLENLARTLSIEWARHSITTVAIAPGPSTGAGEVAALTAYLASPAGAYFSGCLLDLAGHLAP